MFKRLKAVFDSIVYAGMKPGGGRPQAAQPRRFGALRDRVDRWVSGGANPSDPFYLSNRTTAQKLRFAALVAAPILVLAGCLAAVLLNVFNLGHPQEAEEKPASQVAAELLPNLSKDLKIETNRDLEVGDVHVMNNGSSKLIGTARNNTDHVIRKAELTFELTDKTGSRAGAVNTIVENVAAKSAVTFQFSIPQSEAVFALVREVRIIR
jgi:hypothetical protein